MGRGSPTQGRRARTASTPRTLKRTRSVQTAMTDKSTKKPSKNGNGHDAGMATAYLRSAMLGQGPGETNSFSARDMERVDRELKRIAKQVK